MLRPLSIWTLLVSLVFAPWDAEAATSQQVRSSLNRGREYLRGRISQQGGARRTLSALALYKAGVPKEAPEIQDAAKELLKKFDQQKYLAAVSNDAIYEAGVEATFLADLDSEKYLPQIQMIADYIIEQQQDNGGWDYPGRGHGPGSNGDTSVMQYACLGLWAAERAGVTIPVDVWQKVLGWHERFQNNDGGFAYCPGMATGEGMGASTLNMSVNGVGSMHIALMSLRPGFQPIRATVKRESPQDPNRPKPKFGVLEAVDADADVAQPAPANEGEEQTEPEPADRSSISNDVIESIQRTYNYVTTRYRAVNDQTGNRAYYYYSLERMAALANVELIGNRDWFDECSTHLVESQLPNGSWTLSTHAVYSAELDTAFCLLFLSRSTGRLLRRVREPGFGDGTLAGGRGLPEDMTNLDFNGRNVVMQKKEVAPLDKLLASLQNSGDLEIEDLQLQIVENVQLGDRELLIGQIDRLKELAEHPQADVRKTAIWALGRSDRLDVLTLLIDGLNDPDLGVMIESQNALRWLSRKPTGFGLPDDPLETLPPDASEEQKKDAIALWHRNALLAWGQWFLENRPYSERGDEFESRLRLQMEDLKRVRQ